jgi:hypothetical protein
MTRGEGSITVSTHHRGQSRTRASASTASRKQGILGLATRTRASARLGSGVTQATDQNNRGKLLVDLTGDPAGPHKIPRSGPACSRDTPKGTSLLEFPPSPLF